MREDMTEARNRTVIRVLGLAIVAGAVAGALGVYFMGGAPGNGSEAAANCAPALKAADALKPFARGEVAAFRVATEPDQMTDLAFKAPDGSDTSLAALAGKTVLVNIWATWCVPCRAEMPTLDKLQAANGGKDFQVAAVNIDLNNTERAKAFLKEIGVKNLAFYSDPSSGIFTKLKGRGLGFGLPTTILVDGKGCRLGVVEGPAEWDSNDARALIEAAAKAETGAS
jgi:thiol-disulfide isomerase/thioredoxin